MIQEGEIEVSNRVKFGTSLQSANGTNFRLSECMPFVIYLFSFPVVFNVFLWIRTFAIVVLRICNSLEDVCQHILPETVLCKSLWCLLRCSSENPVLCHNSQYILDIVSDTWPSWVRSS